MEARLIIVSEPHHADLIKDCVKKGDVLIATSTNNRNILEQMGFEPKLPALRNYSDDFFIKWMKGLPKAAEKNGVDLLTVLSYDDLSYWWLMEKWLFRGDGHFDSVSDVLNAVEIIHNTIKKYNPDKIIYVNDGRLYSKVIRFIAEQKGIITYGIPFSSGFQLKKTVADLLIKHFWSISFYYRKILSFNHTKAKKGVDVLFLRGVAWERVYDYNTGRMKVREPFTEALRSSFEKSISVGYQIGTNFGLAGNVRILENYYDKKSKKIYKNATKKIKHSFYMLADNEKFREAFVFMGYKIWPLVESQFLRYFDFRLSGHARVHAMISRMLDIEKPKTTVSPEEVSETARILFSCSIKRGIPCVAVQHGIFDNNILCYHNKGETSSTKAHPKLCPLPIKTCVYGQYYKDILVSKGRYPEKNVVVTGSQRFDRIIGQEFNKESFNNRYSIPTDSKIIAYITSPTPFNKEMTIALLEEAKKISKAFVVIKIHQSEKRKFYEDIVKYTGSDAIILDKADLYDVLNASDVVITYLSTAGLEAMLFGKPLIVLNLTGEKDIVKYAISGAAAGVYERRNIKPVIDEMLTKGKLYEKIQKIASSFVMKNAFNIDGKATERISEVIRKLIKK